jgi:putative acetyltransferase
MDILIHKEDILDFDRVREVVKSAFCRQNTAEDFNEWVLVEKIRESEYYVNELSLVADVNGLVVGHIMFSPMKITGKSGAFDSLALAPISVHRDFQKRGIGKDLVKAGIEAAKRLGYKSIVVLGDPAYYTKFGFEKAAKYKIGITEAFDDEYLFVLELVKGSLAEVSGVVKYCPAFYNELGELI